VFKNLKLAVKIGGGFSLVVLLTAVISVFCVLGLDQLRKTSFKNDTTSLIVQAMQTGTLAGKNFVITKQASYANEVTAAMKDIVEKATALRSIESNAKDVSTFNLIIEGANTYSVNFGDYAKYEAQKTEKEATLGADAAELDKSLQNLLDSQRGKASLHDAVNNLLVDLYKARFYLSRYLYNKDSKNVEAMGQYLDELQNGLKILKDKLSDQKGKSIADAVLAAAARYQQSANDYVYLNATQEISRQKAADGGAQTILSATGVSDAAAKKMSSLMAGTIGFVVIIAIVAIILAILLALAITRAITGAMKKGVNFAKTIAQGNLSAKLDINQNDEIGELAAALRDMLARLTRIVEEVNTAARQVASGSQQLSSTSQQMSQGATEQAASVEEISSSMEEMTSNIKQNADNAMQTEKIAQKSALAAEDGGKAVAATVEAMKQIASKIGIIEEIARSTNMLALNASIEAARAGDYGKGFAVVASEVGKLAERSQKEAGEISKLSIESVSIAEQAGSTIGAMIPDIKRTAELVQEISAASNEQNSGAEQINSAILQLDQVVQQNASASEESASMSEELASQADQMQGTISFFKIGAAGEGAKRPAVQKKAAEPTPAAASPVPAAEKNPKPRTAETRKAVAVSPAEPKSAVNSARKPLSGIKIVLDDDSGKPGRDSIDNDFQEF
jgi:methyl-accepting chemotaxis protein